MIIFVHQNFLKTVFNPIFWYTIPFEFMWADREFQMDIVCIVKKTGVEYGYYIFFIYLASAFFWGTLSANFGFVDLFVIV